MKRYKCKFRMRGRGQEKKKEELLEAIPSLPSSLADIISDYTDKIDFFSDLPPNVKDIIYDYYANNVDLYGRRIMSASDYPDPIDDYLYQILPPNVKDIIYKYFDNTLDYGREIREQILQDLIVRKLYSEHPPPPSSSSSFYSDIPPLPESDEEKEGGI